MNAAARRPLTDRQRHVYDAVAAFIRQHGYGPTLRELRALALVPPLAFDDDASAGPRGLVLDAGTATRCAALLRELLDGTRGDDLVLTAEHDRDLRALLAALTDHRAADIAASPHASSPAHGGR